MTVLLVKSRIFTKCFLFQTKQWKLRRGGGKISIQEGKFFKCIVFLFNNICFSSKMGCVTLSIYVFIIFILYWFLNHFSVCCMCGFVRYEAVNSTVSESFSQQNFCFACTCGGLLGGRKGLFQSENLRSSKTIPQILLLKSHSLKKKEKNCL